MTTEKGDVMQRNKKIIIRFTPIEFYRIKQINGGGENV